MSGRGLCEEPIDCARIERAHGGVIREHRRRDVEPADELFEVSCGDGGNRCRDPTDLRFPLAPRTIRRPEGHERERYKEGGCRNQQLTTNWLSIEQLQVTGRS
jgi:hypothetical protein